MDVVVVADDLPARIPERTALLGVNGTPRVQPVGFTPAEFDRARARRNPLVLEALERGIVLIDDGAIQEPSADA